MVLTMVHLQCCILLDSYKAVKVIAEAFGDENHRGSLLQFHQPIAKEADELR